MQGVDPLSSFAVTILALRSAQSKVRTSQHPHRFARSVPKPPRHSPCHSGLVASSCHPYTARMTPISRALVVLTFVLVANGCVSSQRTYVPIPDKTAAATPATQEIAAAPAPPATPPPPAAAPAPPPEQSQGVYSPPVALPPETKPEEFAAIAKTDSAYVTALDAHDLERAHQKLDQLGAFKGTVSGIYEPSAGKLRILNFDTDYRTALSAVLSSEDAGKFPDINQLVGKEVLVSGTFVDYHGRAEIVVKSPDQIKLVRE